MPLWTRSTNWILDHPRVILVAIVAITIVLGYFSTTVETDHRAGHFLATDSEVVQNFNKFNEEFGANQTILYIVFPDQDPTSRAFLSKMDSVTSLVGTFDGVEHVLSLSNAPYPVRVGDSVVTKTMFDPLATEELNRQTIRDQTFLRGLLLSNDGSDGAMIVDIEESFNESPERVELVNRIESLTGSVFGNVALAGIPYLRTQYAQRVTAEAPFFTVAALLVSLGLLFITFRARRAVTLPTIIVALGITWTVGLIALFNHKMNIVTSVLPALLVIIGMANAIHLTTKFFDRYRLLGRRREAIIQTMNIVGLATFLTSVTTAVGFAALMLSGSQLLSVFGQYAAMGIMLLYAISITIIPLVFSRLKPPSHKDQRLATHQGLTRLFDFLALWTRRFSKTIIFGSVCILALSILGVSRISSDIFVFADFYDDDPLVRNLDIYESGFGGILPMEIIIESKTEGKFRSINEIRKLSRLQETIVRHDAIGRTLSAADLVKWTTQAYFGGNPRAYRMPTSYELPFIQDAVSGLTGNTTGGSLSSLPRMFDSTLTSARVFAGVYDIGTSNMNALLDSVLVETHKVFPEDRYAAYITGTAIKATRSGENLVINLAISLSVALVIISLIMGFLFRSVRLTLISLAPNVLPLLIVGGTMGFTGIVLKPSTALIFPLAFGIAVDDTIHFLAKYRIVRSAGLAKNVAIRTTLRETGKAILFTSLVLMCGFLVFTFSSFGGTVNLGALTALTLTMALIANLILLPALLYRYGPADDVTRWQKLQEDERVVDVPLD
ncbi:MAG: MMPL family transporter [Rhodothermales bacterium]|nr:MMPL family transporter [Rhodothermales bacterium]